jgi:hypothetical protein
MLSLASPLLQPNACSAAILRDELDAGLFEGFVSFSLVFGRPPIGPSTDSSLATVGSDVPDASARSPCDHARSALAALIWRTVIIGVMRALDRNVARVFTDRRKTHWGKRKLKRDL